VFFLTAVNQHPTKTSELDINFLTP